MYDKKARWSANTDPKLLAQLAVECLLERLVRLNFSPGKLPETVGSLSNEDSSAVPPHCSCDDLHSSLRLRPRAFTFWRFECIPEKPAQAPGLLGPRPTAARARELALAKRACRVSRSQKTIFRARKW